MGLSDDSDEQRFEELCLDLNMDKNAKDEAAQAYERIRRNYTLEVKIHRNPTDFISQSAMFVLKFLSFDANFCE